MGSVTSYQKAKQFWTDVTGRYPEALAGFTPDIQEADIPGKGIHYRVRVGPMGGGEAKALCQQLDGNCLVVSR
ncbi:MAG: SPOR domain-containing protein [Alphaproteobacteria bacterium]